MDSFVCKIVVVETKEQRVLKPRRLEDRDNSTRPTKASAIKKCLFGVACPGDTEKMLQEQYESDRQRFSEKFGFDIQEIDNMDSENNENSVNGRVAVSKKCQSERRVLKAQRRVFKPYNRQAVMTDFYQARKNVQSGEKRPKDSKEN